MLAFKFGVLKKLNPIQNQSNHKPENPLWPIYIIGHLKLKLSPFEAQTVAVWNPKIQQERERERERERENVRDNESVRERRKKLSTKWVASCYSNLLLVADYSSKLLKILVLATI